MPITSPAMSIAIRQTTLTNRRTRVFKGIGERMYGRLERASATGSPFSGSAATRRSYLADNLDYRVRPVVERVIADDPASQFSPDVCPRLLRSRDDGGERRREGGGIARRRDEFERQIGEELRQRRIRRHDRSCAGGG